MTTQAEIRASFWEQTPYSGTHYKGKRRKTQNEYPCDIRIAFCDYVEALRRDRVISEALAFRATL